MAWPDFDIPPLNREAAPDIQQRIDQKTKPPGALGALESLAHQLALIQAGRFSDQNIHVDQPTLLVFAGDHGIARHGVSIAPPEVTRQMVLNFLHGGAAINCFCRTAEMTLQVVDTGILEPIDDPRLIVQRLGKGTGDISETAAMSLAQVREGIGLGAGLSHALAKQGTTVIGFGEMGIGNTTVASALMAALLRLSANETVGRGTGINDEQFEKKRRLVELALATHRAATRSAEIPVPYACLAALGGFEIVQMTGAMLGAAEHRMTILVDGFISTVAALYATHIAPDSRDYMVFCHQSEEKAHRRLLDTLNALPLLSLGLRLGEGTGAALALPLIRAAAAFYNDMASFRQAGVDAV